MQPPRCECPPAPASHPPSIPSSRLPLLAAALTLRPFSPSRSPAASSATPQASPQAAASSSEALRTALRAKTSPPPTISPASMLTPTRPTCITTPETTSPSHPPGYAGANCLQPAPRPAHKKCPKLSITLLGINCILNRLNAVQGANLGYKEHERLFTGPTAMRRDAPGKSALFVVSRENMGSGSLHQHQSRIFEILLQCREVLSANGSVHDPVIAAHPNPHTVAGDDFACGIDHRDFF